MPGEIVGALPGVARWKLASLPRHVSAADVERIIAATPPASPSLRRDRAVLLLLARLALRRSDVADLTFDSFDWREGRVRVAGKGRREDWLPLPQDAGDAVLAYLRRDRPKHPSPRVFLSTRAPHRPMTRSRVTGIVADAIRRSGVDAPLRGAHLLRHSAAVALLNGGLGLDGVLAVLRHAHSEITFVYAKVDRPLLSTVVARWPQASRTHQAARDLSGLAVAWPEPDLSGLALEWSDEQEGR
jgi:integrase